MRSRTMSIVSAELEELRGRRPSFDFACKFRLIHQMHLHWILEFSTVRFKTVWFNWEKMSDNSDLLPIQLKSPLFLLTCRMGLAISLVAMEKEKVGWMTQLHSSFWLCLFFKIVWFNLSSCAGVVPRLPEPRQGLLQHPAEGGWRLHHLVQRERGEQRRRKLSEQ